MSFQQLTYLLEVHKAGSFSQAAKNLFITQSAISNAIIGLEKEIGAPLFLRSQYGLAPTPRGEEVIHQAERIFECMQKITEKETACKKSVRIGSSNYPAVANAYVRLLKEYPNKTDVEFSLRDTRAGSLMKNVIVNEMDIAIYAKLTSYSSSNKESIEQQGLYYEELATIPSVIVIGPKHPLYHKEVVEMGDLRQYPMMDGSKTGICSAKTLSAYIPYSRSNLIIASSYHARRKILEDGLAYQVTFLPAEKDRVKEFRYIPIKGLSHTLYYITNPTRPRCEELERFIEILKEEIVIS